MRINPGGPLSTKDVMGRDNEIARHWQVLERRGTGICKNLMRNVKPLSLLFGAVAALPLAAAVDDGEKENDESAHGAALEEVVVSAHPLSAGGLAEAVVTLDAEALENALALSIGATMARMPGIHSASFGEAVGRPVVHGMSGPRVRVMEDRIDAMDASVTSGDHAVTVEPFLAERVDALKGPSTLLYGSGAIGGVIDVHTGRIPHRLPEALSGDVALRAQDNGRGANVAGRANGGRGGFAWHVDGFSRSAGEYRIPGFAESARARAAEEEEEAHDEDEHDEDEHHDEMPASGRLPGSHADGSGGAVGLSWIGARGFAGVAVSKLRYDYGLPGEAHAHEDEAHEEDDHEEDEHEDEGHDEDGASDGTVTLDVEQTRIDFEAGVVEPFSGFEFLNIRAGRNDYAHLEIEPDGAIGTRFHTDSYEGRVELVRKQDTGFDGTFGVHFAHRDFSAIGEEAFVPPVTSAMIGAFWVGERPLGRFDLEAGVRLERVRHEPERGPDRRFGVHSLSLGLVAELGGGQLGLSGSYSVRAPAAEELYSDGPHLATRSFEIGDVDLEPERALHAALTWNWQGERFAVAATGYATAFRDHIYGAPDGTEMDHLPVFRFTQQDAVYRGVDLSVRYTVAELALGRVELSCLFDTVAARVDVAGDDQLPRLPPTRFGVGMHVHRAAMTFDLDYLHAFAQDEVAPNELPTDSYGDLRARVAVRVPAGGADIRVFLQGRNLTDEEQRYHTSIIKDLAPAPGRAWEAGVRWSF